VVSNADRQNAPAPLIEAALEIQEVCRANNWAFAVIGAMAVLRWGEPRATQDVDLTILTGLGGEQDFIDALRKKFAPRYLGAEQLALEARILLLTAGNGTPIDVSFAWLPWEQRAIENASDFAFKPRQVLRTLSLNDLVVYKAASDRPRDGADLQGIVARHEPQIDWNYVREQLGEVCELLESDEPQSRLQRIRDEVGAAFKAPRKGD
jgi:hypothetical protein